MNNLNKKEKPAKHDKKYKSSLWLSIILIVIGFIFIKQSTISFICLTSSYILICGLHIDYKNIFIISFIYWIETICIVVYLLYGLYAFINLVYNMPG